VQQVDFLSTRILVMLPGCLRIKRWVSSINLVNAAGLRPQDSAFVGLSNFPSFDRNHAGKERTHLAIPGADRVFELTDYTRGTGKTFSAKIVIKSSLGGDRFVGVSEQTNAGMRNFVIEKQPST
jgi:hypothetical protein